MTKELTDEEVFGTQSGPVTGATKEPAQAIPAVPPPKLELSDEEVFGPPKEMTDEEVFGESIDPIDRFSSATKRASELEKSYKSSVEEYEKFSALPLTEADEPERIRLYAGARNAGRALNDEINAVNKLRPAYEVAIEEQKQAETASIEKLRENIITMPLADSLLNARDQRDKSLQDLTEMGLDGVEYNEQAKKIVSDYSNFVNSEQQRVFKENEENKILIRDLLNDSRRVFESGDRQVTTTEAIGGVAVGTPEYQNLASLAEDLGPEYVDQIISRSSTLRDKARGVVSSVMEGGILGAPIVLGDAVLAGIGAITTDADQAADKIAELENLREQASNGDVEAATELENQESKLRNEALRSIIYELPLEERSKIRKDFLAQKQEKRLAGLPPERRQGIIDSTQKIMESYEASLFDPESVSALGAALPDGSLYLTAKGKMDINASIDKLVEAGKLPEVKSNFYKSYYTKLEEDRSRAIRGASIETTSFKNWLEENPEYAEEIKTDQGTQKALDAYEGSHNTIGANLIDIVPSLFKGIGSYISDGTVGATLTTIALSDMSDEQKADKMLDVYIQEQEGMGDVEPTSFLGSAAEVTGNFLSQALPMVTLKFLSLFGPTKQMAKNLMDPARAYTMAHMGAVYAAQGYIDSVDQAVKESGYESIQDIQKKDPKLAEEINRKGQAAMIDAAKISISEQLPIEGLVSSIGSKTKTPTAFKRLMEALVINPSAEIAQEIFADTLMQSSQSRYSAENKSIEMMGLGEIAQMYVGVLPVTGGTAIGARMEDRRQERIKEIVANLSAEEKQQKEAAEASAQAAERAAQYAPQSASALKEQANNVTAKVLREAEAREPEEQGPSIPETRTIGESIRDKDTFVYQGMRGAITEEDGEVVFREFGTQTKYIVPVAPDQTIAEIEELQWQRKGQRRQVTGEPIEPTVVEGRSSVVETNPVVTIEEIDAEPDDIEVSLALVEIEKSSILNFLADLFDTGDSSAVQKEKAEYKSGKRKGQVYERETESPVTELPEYYRQATPAQLDQAKRLIDSALRLIDTMNIDGATKERLAEHFLLLDQDITNYEQNPEYKKFRQESGWQVSATGQTSEVPTTATEALAAERELESRVRAETEAIERRKALEAKRAVTPPETPAGSRVKAAAYVAPDGTIYTADSHLNAMQKAADDGKITQAAIAKKQKATSRETPEFGFTTESDSFISRDQAETLAKSSGQILVETPETGRLHSNEVALDDFTPDVDAPPYIARAIVDRSPISVEDVDRAGVEMPKGWKVDGDLYVYAEKEEGDRPPLRRMDAFARLFAYVQDYVDKNPAQAETLRNKVGLIVSNLNKRTIFDFAVNFQDAVITGIQNRLFSALNRGLDPKTINAATLVKSSLSDAKKTYPMEYGKFMDSMQEGRASGKKLDDILSGKVGEEDAKLTAAQKKTLEEEKRRTAAVNRRLEERKLAQRIVEDFEQTLDEEERMAFDFIRATERLKNDPSNKSKRRQADQARQRLEDAVEDYEAIVLSVTGRFAELAERLSGQKLAPKTPKVKQTADGQKIAAEQKEKQGILAEVDAEQNKTEDLTDAEKDARAKSEDPNLNNVGAWVKTLPTNSPLRRLINQVLKVNPSVANVPIQYVAAINGRYDGFYDPNKNRIVLPQSPTQDISLLIGHEIVHAATLGKARLYDERKFDQLTKDELNIFKELDKIRNSMLANFGKGNATFSAIMAISDSAERAVVAAQAVRDGKIGGELYALVNMAEFLANSINNVEFQKALDTVDPNIFRQIWNLIRSLFYKNGEPSASVNALWDSIIAISRETRVGGTTTTPAPSFVLPEYAIKDLPVLENKSDMKAMIDKAVLNRRMDIENAVKLKAVVDIVPDSSYRGAKIILTDKLTRGQRNALDMGLIESFVTRGTTEIYEKVPIIYVNTSKRGDMARTFIHENAHLFLDNILTPELINQAKEIYNSLPVSRQAIFVSEYAKGGDTRFGEWFAESMTDFYERKLSARGVDIASDTILGNVFKKIVDLFSNETSKVDAFFDGLDATLFRAQREIARQAEDKIAPASVSLRSDYEGAVKNGDYGQAKLIEEDTIRRILSVLTPDLLKRDYREANKTNATYGHCYTASEALYHMLGGKASGLRPANGRDGNGVVHWWVKSKDGRIIDPTATQYTSIGLNPPYEVGKGGGFLTKDPSRRAQTVIDRVSAASMERIAPATVKPAVTEVAPEEVQAAEQKATQDFAQDLYGQEPYINHLRRVSEQMPNDKLKTAAFIHDSVEDGKMTLDEVRSQFGDDVAELVDAVSRKDGETYAQFIDRVAQNPEAAQIKLADLRENIRNVEDFKPSLRSRYEKAIAVLEPVVAKVAAPIPEPSTLAPAAIESDKRKLSPEEYATYLEGLSQEVRENIETSENFKGYGLYEARQIAAKMQPNSTKFKKVSDKYFVIDQNWDYIANVDGVPYGLVKEEDPDDEDLRVWAYGKVGTFDFNETIYNVGEEEDVVREMQEDLASTTIAPAAVTSRQDRDYLDAVERGDLETAQRMVDEAAVVVTKPETTDAVFERHKDFKMTGLTLEEIAQNPEALAEKDKDDYNTVIYWVSQIEQGNTPTVVTDERGSLWDGFHRLVASKIAGGETLNVFTSEKETSTDQLSQTVRRDTEGNVIPLSQRFDSTRPEIAFAAVQIPPEEGGTLPPVTNARLEELGVRADETQIVGTERTYKRILETIARKGMSILDFGSGLGHGLKFLKDEAKRLGFEAIGYEPMWRPDRKAASQAPDYIGFESLDLIPDNSQDYIINNAVMNVVAEDVRATIVKQMYDKLKAGGTLFLQARSWTGDVQKLLKNNRNIVVGPREIFVPQKQTFQKGFTPEELINFVESQLPDAKVVRTQFGGVGIAITKPQAIAPAAVTSRQDRDYLDAVERGDLDAASRVVENAAKAAGIPIIGVNINDGEQSFTEQILSRDKTIETRDSENNALAGLVGQRIAIVRTGKGRARVVGYTTVGEPIRYTSKSQFDADYNRHLVSGGKYGFKGFKIGYPMLDVERIDAYDAPPATGVIKTRPIHAPIERDDQGNVIPLSQRFDATRPEIAPAAVAPKISKVSDEYNASRVGTATQGKVKATTQETNVSIETVKPENLKKQMAKLNEFINGVKLPSFITSITNPEKKRDAFIEFVADNLLALYEAFPVELRAAATRWYDGARKLAEGMAKDSGLTVEQSAGILAAFSPMKDWFQNVQMGVQFSKVFKGDLKTKITKTKFKEALEEITNSSTPSARSGRIRLLAQLEGRSIDGLWKEASRNEAKAKKIKEQRNLGAKQYNSLPEAKNAKKLRILASWATRVVATQNYGLDYNVYSPDGDILGKKLKKNSNVPQKMVWQSAVFLEKALSIAYNGSIENISNNLGREHKIRSFYNNIVSPNNPYGDTTIDTHAVNAGVLFPMGNKGKLVNAAFGGAGVAGGGNSGIYWLFHEAYRRASARAKVIDPATGRVVATGIQPRQMQSITWEAIRGLFPDDVKRKKSFVEEIAQVWKNAPDARSARNRIVSRELRIPEWATAYTGSGRSSIGTVASTGRDVRSKTDIARGIRNRLRSGDYGIAPAAIDPNLTPDPDSEDNTSNEAAAISAARADAKIAQESIIGHSILADEIPPELREELEATYKNGMTLEEFINSDAINLNESYYPYAVAVWLDLNGGLMPTVKIKDKKIERLEQGTAESETVRMLNRAFTIYNNASDSVEGGKEITYAVGDIVSTWLRSGLDVAALRNAIVQFTNLDVNGAIAIAEDTLTQYGIQERIVDSRDRARSRMERAIPAITARQASEKERMIRLEQAAGTIDSIAEAIKLAYDVNVNKARVDRATEKKQIQEQLRQAKRILREVVPREYLGEQLTALERAAGLDGLKKIVEVAQDALNKARVDYAVTQARKAFDRASKAVKAGTLTPEAEAILRGFVDQYTKSGMSDKTKAEVQAVLDEFTNDPINALKRLTTTKSGKQIYAIDKYIKRKGQLAAIKIDKSLGLDALREITDIINSTMHMDKMAKGELLFNKKMKREEWKKAIVAEIANVKAITKEEKGFGPKLGGFKWNAIFRGARVENILRGLGLESMRKFIYETLVLDAYNDELRNRIGLKRKIEGAFKEITGLEIGSKDYDKYSKQLFEVAGLDQNNNATTIQIRRSEMIDMVASLRDANNFKKVVRAGGFVIDRLRGSSKGDTVAITPQSYMQLQDSMTESDLNMVNFVVGLYNNDLFTLLNDSSIQTYGHGIKKTNGVYYPRNAFKWDRVNETSADLDYMQYYNSRVDSVGHLKERTDEANARLVAVDFLSRLDYHVTNDSRISAYLAVVQDINSILKDGEVMRPLELKVGAEVVNQIQEMVRQQTVPLPGLADGLINTLVGNAGIGILGFKIHAALQNPVGIPIAMAYYGKDGYKYSAKALGFLRKGFNRSEYIKMAEVLNRYTPYFAERYGEGGFIQEFTSGLAAGPSDTRWRKNMEDKSLSWLEMTDKMGALARYKTAIEVIKDRTELEQGTEEFNRAVAREWNLMMFRSENTSHGADRTGFFQFAAKNPMAKIFLMFQSAVSKQYSLFAEAVIQAQQGGRENLQEAAMKMSFVAASVYMSLAISSAFYGILFPPDEEDETTVTDVMGRLLSAPLAIVPVLGNTLQTMVAGWFSPENIRKPLQLDIISSFIFGTIDAFDLAFKGIRQIGEGDIDTKTGNPEWWNTSFKAIEKGMNLFGIAKGIPIGGLMQSGKFVKRLGERVWDSVDGDMPSDENFQKKLAKVKREAAPEPTTQEYAKMYFAVAENNPNKFKRALRDLKEKNPNATRDNMIASIRRRPEFMIVSMVERGDVKIGEHGITRDEYLSKRALRSSMEQLSIDMWREAKD